MTLRVAINGFGRVGRTFFRKAISTPGIEIVGINGVKDISTLVHLLKYDSTFGRFEKEVTFDENYIVVEGKRIRTTAIREPGNLPWKELGVDIVMDSTGQFKDIETAMPHIDAGAKKVVISAQAKTDHATLVYGVNHQNFDPEKHIIISNSSCTTNALAPVMKVLDEQFGVEKGLMATVHAYTNDQVTLDKSHKDLRRARAAACSIIPTTTGAAKAVAKVLPQMKGKLNGFAMRVPVCNVSIIDLNVELKKPATKEEINAVFAAQAAGEMKGIIGYSDEPLVSVDYIGTECSGTIDALSTMVLDDMAKIVIWYDNEWGYCCRLLDLIMYMGEKM